MAGWNKQRVAAFKSAFADFLKYVVIDTKDYGEMALKLYGSQRRFLTEVFEGLERDIHHFTVLKARQLGMSTIVRVLIIFWAFMHPGLRVALVYDTDKNKQDARAEIRLFLSKLPASHRIQIAKGGDNRDFLQFENGSRISYLVAGIKKTASSGGLGRGLGINCCGATECSSWADVEGLRSFERSLSDRFPDRLFIFESTARGFNIFRDMWLEAQDDDLAKKAIFIGWWAHEGYAIQRESPLFDRYGEEKPTEEEAEKIEQVKRLYNVDISMEQLAWFRHEYDPNHDSGVRERMGQDFIQQELPWTEEEAFIQSGSKFFPVNQLTDLAKESERAPVKNYKYFMSSDFLNTLLDEVKISRNATLRVWEEPDPTGVYCIGADPAYGSSEDADRHCAQVIRCYADGVDQVAEFCSPDGPPYQFCWVIAHLCGAYSNARLLLELNGPGNAVWGEFRTLETMMRVGEMHKIAEERGLGNIFENVKHYLWKRTDALNQNPTAFHFETSTKRKIMIFERLRDFVHAKQIKVRSMECIEEMRRIVRDGDSIKGEGIEKDDRVMALALAVHAWESSERKRMIMEMRSRENEAKRKQLTHQDVYEIFNTSLMQNFFHERRRATIRANLAMRGRSRYDL